jgi:hypothetical protein
MMPTPPRIFPIVALLLVAAMAWANHRGYMFSSLFGGSDSATRSASGNLNHK